MIGNRYFDAILSNFPNGKEKYNNSALFRQMVDSILFTNTTPYECIDQLIAMVESTQKEFRQYVERDTRPMIIYENKSINTNRI